MTLLADAPALARRTASPRRWLMCRPEHFTVSYEINPWMDATRATDRDLALAQWQALHDLYLALGHEVELVDPVPGLPDMVFAANGGLVVDGTAYGVLFTHPERQPEGPAYLDRLRQLGLRQVVPATQRNEGEGDVLLVGDVLLAGWGFRTALESHAEVQEVLRRPVVSLQLVDPRFYHLDTALAVLDERTVAYYPDAFSPGGREVLRRLFPDAVLATEEDAVVLGLNAVSDGRNVVLSQEATHLAARLRERGFVVHGVATSELRKAGGSAKCCTLQVRA